MSHLTLKSVKLEPLLIQKKKEKDILVILHREKYFWSDEHYEDGSKKRNFKNRIISRTWIKK